MKLQIIILLLFHLHTVAFADEQEKKYSIGMENRYSGNVNTPRYEPKEYRDEGYKSGGSSKVEAEKQRLENIRDGIPRASDKYTPSQEVQALQRAADLLDEHTQKISEAHEKILSLDHYEERAEYLSYAERSTSVAKRYFREEDIEAGKIALEIGKVFLDFALSLWPPTEWARDLIEAVTGYDIVSKEELDTFSRSVCVLSVATFGFAGQANKVIKIVTKLTKGKFWTKSKYLGFNAVENAYDHWKRHGKQFPNLKNSVEYVEEAHSFMKYPSKDTLSHVRKNGEHMFYHEPTNTFAVLNKDGVPKTMYKPDEGLVYWQKELAKDAAK